MKPNNYLKEIANSDFISPPAREWVFVYYHFNRDSEPIHDPQYRFSLGQHSDYSYMKTFDDGTIKIDASQLSTVDMVLVDGEDGMMHIFMAVWSKFTF